MDMHTFRQHVTTLQNAFRHPSLMEQLNRFFHALLKIEWMLPPEPEPGHIQHAITAWAAVVHTHLRTAQHAPPAWVEQLRQNILLALAHVPLREGGREELQAVLAQI